MKAQIGDRLVLKPPTPKITTDAVSGWRCATPR
jgi:hypothetical protein